ncbi:hypothetical protein TNCT_600201 [Trichonephila clavata]|uniref:Uncharacterized protein n=1 Tax=Trichonephila clavata TaxID=2740835 RepID=A0A8X6HY06_TRICU|nr:hypothetical protein TNCT_600201 [Trichonephila clavata]
MVGKLTVQNNKCLRCLPIIIPLRSDRIGLRLAIKLLLTALQAPGFNMPLGKHLMKKPNRCGKTIGSNEVMSSRRSFHPPQGHFRKVIGDCPNTRIVSQPILLAVIGGGD